MLLFWIYKMQPLEALNYFRTAEYSSCANANLILRRQAVLHWTFYV